MDRLCSGEIYGFKFSVPCFPEKYLENSYNVSWKNPESELYEDTNVLYEPEEWSNREWFDAIHYYYLNGERNNMETYNYIISQSNLTRQPSFEAYLKYIYNFNKTELLSYL